MPPKAGQPNPPSIRVQHPVLQCAFAARGFVGAALRGRPIRSLDLMLGAATECRPYNDPSKRSNRIVHFTVGLREE